MACEAHVAVVGLAVELGVGLNLPAMLEAEGIVGVEHPKGLVEGTAAIVEVERKPLLYHCHGPCGAVASPGASGGGKDIELVLGLVEVAVRHEHHTVVVHRGAPAAHEVGIMRIVGSYGEELVHGIQPDGMFRRRLQFGISLLHHITVVVRKRIVEFPERRTLGAAGIRKREIHLAHDGRSGERGEEVVVAAVEVLRGIGEFAVVETCMLVAQSGTDVCPLSDAEGILHECGIGVVLDLRLRVGQSGTGAGIEVVATNEGFFGAEHQLSLPNGVREHEFCRHHVVRSLFQRCHVAVGRTGILRQLLPAVVVREEHVGVEVDVHLPHLSVVVGIHEHVVGIEPPGGAVGNDGFFKHPAFATLHIHPFVHVGACGDGIVRLGTEGVALVDLPVEASAEVGAYAAP